MDYILKTARDEANVILWQAVYVGGIKQFEAKQLDEEAIKRVLDVPSLLAVNMVEPNSFHYASAFPAQEDFSYMLDYAPLHVGKKVYLEHGTFEVATLTPTYRRAGHYPYRNWYYRDGQLRRRTKQTLYTGHEALEFTVVGEGKTYVWEDYNYQQSWLREYLG